MRCLLVLAVVLGTTLASRPCAAPMQLTFRSYQWQSNSDYFSHYFGQYDRQNSRVVIFEESENGTVKDLRQFLFLHNEHRGYDLDLKSHVCKSFYIGNFEPWEVPANAKYLGEFTLGGPEEVVTVDQWSDQTPHSSLTWLADFSLLNCYPVKRLLKESTQFNTTIHTNYYDIIEGITNPNDFNIPPECNQARDNNDVIAMPFQARLAKSMVSVTL